MSAPVTKVVLAPIDVKIAVDSIFTDFVKRQLLKRHKEPVGDHDVIEILLPGQPMKFLVAEIEPRLGLFVESTELEIKGEPLYPPKPEKALEALSKKFNEERDRSFNARMLSLMLQKPSSPMFQDTFVTKIVSGGRVTIPEALREIYGLKEGDILKIGFKLLKRVKEESEGD